MSGMIERLEEALEQGRKQQDRDPHIKAVFVPIAALPSLLKLVRAAQGLDAALAEQHSRFDSDGVYERYWICPPEEEALVAALAEVEGKP